MPIRKSIRPYMIAVALLLVASALAYLPNLLQATVYRDDWYYVMDRMIGGPGIFQAMFSIDRPARGPFFELYYQFFGASPLPYHIASYAWRLLGGLSALWLFRMVWPRQPRATMLMAVLFVLFPGYLRWMEGFEDQPRIASACLEALSFALTLKAIGTAERLPKIAAWIGSILTGWAYLALLDFAVGMEVFRFLCVFVFIDQQTEQGSLIKRTVAALRAWAMTALIPIGFLFWRLFIFHNERPQTDVGRQLGVLFGSPFATALAWSMRLLQSMTDVLVFSWMTPVLHDFFNLGSRGLLFGGVLAALAVAALYLAYYLLSREIGGDENASGDISPQTSWNSSAMIIGLVGAFFGVLPVILANRYVDFQSFSHYALPVSLVASVFITGLISSLRPVRIRIHAAAFLVACAMLTHFTYSSAIVDEERTISAFWHQVAWRAPAIRAGTTLFVSYPGFSYGDNADAVAGPANLIYFPEETGDIPATYPLMALPQASKTTNDIVIGRDQQTGYRTHIGSFDFERLLVFSRPSASSCVRAINAQQQLYSSQDPEQIRVIGRYSHADNILNSGSSPKLWEVMFGPEPAHKWCYYFEKAELAAQFGDWQKVADLGNEATAANLHADDWIEWTPFLHAYALLGDEEHFTATAHRLNGDPFARMQACSILASMQASGTAFTAEIQAQMNSLLCKGK